MKDKHVSQFWTLPLSFGAGGGPPGEAAEPFPREAGTGFCPPPPTAAHPWLHLGARGTATTSALRVGKALEPPSEGPRPALRVGKALGPPSEGPRPALRVGKALELPQRDPDPPSEWGRPWGLPQRDPDRKSVV